MQTRADLKDLCRQPAFFVNVGDECYVRFGDGTKVTFQDSDKGGMWHTKYMVLMPVELYEVVLFYELLADIKTVQEFMSGIEARALMLNIVERCRRPARSNIRSAVSSSARGSNNQQVKHAL